MPGGLDPARIFAGIDFSARRSVVAAVSGGGDSLALLHLLADLAPRPSVVAVTVDHGLRAEAAREAAEVRAIAGRLGLAHRTLIWTGGMGGAGVQAAAREARHRLLAEAARDAGTDIVLTGHTLDDRAETVLMRAARGTGDAVARGEAGIAPATLHEGRTWFMRPLIGLRRASLRDWLASRGVAWIEDPTNEDPRYERTRARAAIASMGEQGFAALVARADEAARARARLGEAAAKLIRAHASMPAPGLFRIDPALLDEPDGEAARYTMRILLSLAGGREHLPAGEAAARLIEQLREGRPCGGPARASLARAVVDMRASGIFLHRERRALPPPRPAASGLWDGRHRLETDGAAAGLFVAPLGMERAGELAGTGSGVPPALVKAALAAEPALWRDGRFESLPGPGAGGAVRILPALGAWARFLPSFDLAAAAAAARLTGTTLPDPPSPGHIGAPSSART